MRWGVVAEPLSFHPGLDSVTNALGVHDVAGDTAFLSAVVIDAYHVTQASGRQFVMVARPDARATYPLRVALRTANFGWACHDDHLPGGRATSNGPAQARPGRSEEDVSGRVELDVLFTCPPADVGGYVEAVLGAVTSALELSPLRGWGLSEPVTQRWGARELSRLVAERRPQPTTLVVLGGDPESGPLTGLVSVEQTETSAQVHAAVAVGTSAGAALRSRTADALPAALVNAARLTLATASWCPGPADTTSCPATDVPISALWALLGQETRSARSAMESLGHGCDLDGGNGVHVLVALAPGVQPHDVARLLSF